VAVNEDCGQRVVTRESSLLRLPQPEGSSYDGYAFANSAQVKCRASGTGSVCRTAVRGPGSAADVPALAHPRRDGHLLSHPSTKSAYTHPPAQGGGRARDGRLRLDVENFRTPDREVSCGASTRRPTSTSGWRSTCSVPELGLLHAGRDGCRPHPPWVWSHMDPAHHKYEPGTLESAILDYYRHVDRELGEMLASARPRRWCSSSPITREEDGWGHLLQRVVAERRVPDTHHLAHQADRSQRAIDWARTRAGVTVATTVGSS